MGSRQWCVKSEHCQQASRQAQRVSATGKTSTQCQQQARQAQRVSATGKTSTKRVSNGQSATHIAGHVVARCFRQCVKSVVSRHPDKYRVSATHMTEHVADRCFRQCVKSIVSRHPDKHKEFQQHTWPNMLLQGASGSALRLLSAGIQTSTESFSNTHDWTHCCKVLQAVC